MAEIYQYLQKGDIYQFVTVQDVAVTVRLSKDPRWFPNNPEIEKAHSFFIETDKPSMVLDIRLRNTVLHVMTNFFKQNNAIIIYFCDPRDGRGNTRYAKFNRWFGLVNDPSIEKHDRQVFVTDLRVDENVNLVRSELSVHASILLRKTHPNYDAAIRIFHSGDLDKTGKL